MTNIQDILSPVRHLYVFDRLATFPDEPERSEYQILIWFYRSMLSESSRPEKQDVLGHGTTEAEAAINAMGELVQRLNVDIASLENFRSRCVAAIDKAKSR